MEKKGSTKILVIKIGTSVLTDKKGALDSNIIKSVAEDVGRIKKRGWGVIIVSSGAVVAGMQLLGMTKRPEYLPEIQACAAIGQGQLIKVYTEHFKELDIMTAQVLLTRDDIHNRTRYLNAKNTILSLLKKGAVPVINENDTVSTEEIRFGDNDRLSSLVASLIEADKLIILSNVDGLYEYAKSGTPKLIRKVEKITKAVEDLATKETGRLSIGGMASKIQAAKTVTGSGITCIFANGGLKDILRLAIKDDGAPCTVFSAHKEKMAAKKRWIAHSSRCGGSIKVDDGARDALTKRNKSLLSSGIISGEGKFEAGDCVSVTGEDGKEFARGLTNYSSDEVSKIKGKKTGEIKDALGYKYYDEVINRDNLAVL